MELTIKIKTLDLKRVNEEMIYVILMMYILLLLVRLLQLIQIAMMIIFCMKEN